MTLPDKGTAAPAASKVPAEPPHDCTLCPRLAGFRRKNRELYPSFHNGPVESFGTMDAGILVVGLAPGLKGANATGRPFTGDYAGDLLYATLMKKGLASGTYDRRPDDGFHLDGVMVTNAVRCLPPENKPTGAEINSCRPFLLARMDSLKHMKVILALGKIAHDSTVRALGAKLKDHVFGHAAVHKLKHNGHRLTLVDSYHCSRYNVNTGRLTPAMFETAVDACIAAL